jgi:hypothetical protein
LDDKPEGWLRLLLLAARLIYALQISQAPPGSRA